MIFQNIESECFKFQNHKLSLPPVPAELFRIDYEEQLESHEINNGCSKIKSEHMPFKASELFHVPIKCYRKLSDGEDVKSVYEVTFNIENTNLVFEAGNTVGVLPENNITEVTSLISLLQLEEKAQKYYKISANPNVSVATLKKYDTFMKYIPSFGTLQNLFVYHMNIRALVKKLTLRSISVHCNDEQERRCMEILCSKEGSELYNKYILQNNSTLVDILKQFKSCRPPVTVVLQNLPQLLPRPYSICNSQLMNKDELKVCFSVKENEHGVKGVTTGWLQSLLQIKDQKSITNIEKQFTNLNICESGIIQNGDRIYQVPLYLRESSAFRLQTNNNIPILMISTGTGVSPFVGFLRERKIRKKKNPELTMGKTYLFYGCRYKMRDFLFQEELQDYIDDSTLTKLVVAFSRENNLKTYIQDKLKDESSLIIEIIDSGGVIYVCGNAAMEKAVRQSIETCLALAKEIGLPESQAFVRKLQEEQKYIIDVWS